MSSGAGAGSGVICLGTGAEVKKVTPIASVTYLATHNTKGSSGNTVETVGDGDLELFVQRV